MPGRITVDAQTSRRISVVRKTNLEFLDEDLLVVGERFKPSSKEKTVGMVRMRQKTIFDLTVDLLNPDGTAFDLTGATVIRTGLFQRTPVTATQAVVIGTPVGALTDGVVRFSFTETDTDFVGFLEGEIEITNSEGTIGFDLYNVIIEANRLANVT